MNDSLRLGGALSALALLAGCGGGVAAASCDQIATEAKRISEGQSVKITEIRNLSEQSRSDRETRCTGEATLDNNATGPINLRAYYSPEGNTMVEYSTEPFPQPPAQ